MGEANGKRLGHGEYTRGKPPPQQQANEVFTSNFCRSDRQCFLIRRPVSIRSSVDVRAAIKPSLRPTGLTTFISFLFISSYLF